MVAIYYGPAYYRSVEVQHFLSTISFVGHCYERKVPLYVHPQYGDALVERARGRAATRFLLDSDSDVLLQIDGDIAFEAEDAVRVCEQAVERDIVAGIYVTRHRWKGHPTSKLIPGRAYTFDTDPTPQPIVWAAGGFVAAHRRVYERLAKELPLCHPNDPLRHFPFYTPFVATDDGETTMLGEDWAFCERARQAGFGVWANCAVRLTHFGQLPLTLEDCNTEQPAFGPLTLTVGAA